MKNILVIHSSALGENSVSKHLSQNILNAVQKPEDHVKVRDLAQNTPEHWAGSGDQEILREFLNSDTIIIGAPMYNFSIPSVLKSWIDRIAVAGQTFRYTPNGPEGLAGGKTVWISSARGGIYGDKSPMDFQESYLESVLRFLGVTDIRVVRAEGVALGEDAKKMALSQAQNKIQELMAA